MVSVIEALLGSLAVTVVVLEGGPLLLAVWCSTGRYSGGCEQRLASGSLFPILYRE